MEKKIFAFPVMETELIKSEDIISTSGYNEDFFNGNADASWDWGE